MSPSRRAFLRASGRLAVAGLAWTRRSPAAGPIDIAMEGTPGGAHVWFHPGGLLIQPGQTLRWTNRDAGNSHTSTAYHPSLYGKARRIPGAAKPWDSGFLLPGESFSVTLTVPGVYDYYCLPHEQAGMVGRIIVAEPEANGWQTQPGADNGVPAIAIGKFPSIEKIMAEKTVE